MALEAHKQSLVEHCDSLLGQTEQTGRGNYAEIVIVSFAGDFRNTTGWGSYHAGGTIVMEDSCGGATWLGTWDEPVPQPIGRISKSDDRRQLILPSDW